jgi:hypothetical protein
MNVVALLGHVQHRCLDSARGSQSETRSPVDDDFSLISEDDFVSPAFASGSPVSRPANPWRQIHSALATELERTAERPSNDKKQFRDRDALVKELLLSMTLRAAQSLGLSKVGLVQEGFAADLIFLALDGPMTSLFGTFFLGNMTAIELTPTIVWHI